MKKEIELNDAEQRQMNRAKRLALKHQASIEQPNSKQDNPKKGFNFSMGNNNDSLKANNAKEPNKSKGLFSFIKSKKNKKEENIEKTVVVPNSENKPIEENIVQSNITNNDVIKPSADEIVNKIIESNKEEENKADVVPQPIVVDTVETAKAQEDTVVQTNEPKKPKKEKKVKEKRPKGRKVTFVFAILTCIILFFCILGACGAGLFAYKLCEDKPELEVTDLISPDSSTIYDNEGNKIMQIGMYLRENIDYDEMPNCLIDAFLAVEDSRFFEHIGFDIPRFTKAILANLSSGDFSQGGSTITMQLVKNSYFSIDAGEDSTIASREGMSGIKRKMQEIVMSLELELFKDVSKQDIIAMYINKVNYGNNIRGVEKAAEYYFGKSAKDLNLGESAFLAGIINSPNANNPYNQLYKYDSEYLSPDIDYLYNATQRRNEVLNLMVQHGYISEDEATLAKSVRIQDLLVGASNDFGNTNEKYQGYIDAVIDEVEEMTGESPYDVGMNIYTNMNAYMQEYVYDMQNEAEYTKIKFPNDLCQSAIVLMDNQTGAVEALGGGRGETDSARKFNRATSAYLNPGSSMKPIVDYSLAIEKLGWATSHTITDQPYYLYDGPVLISNFDHVYYGDMMMTEALGRSQNTPAVQTLAAVVGEIKEEGVIDYLNSIGFNFEYDDFDLQFAIGGSKCTATPEQMAGAHAIFMNGGKYIKPHTINYIQYVDGRDDYVADTVGKQALSPETAWMTAYLERYNMEGSYSSLMWYCKRDYPLYGKTGTTDWADAGVDYGIPVSSTKDSWLVMQTNRYTISCWTGYDELERGAYFTNAEYQENTKSKIVSAILDQLEEHASYKDYDPYVELAMPDGVVEIEHVKGSYPYAKSGGEMTKGYTSKAALEKQPLVTYDEAIEYSKQFTKEVNAGASDINATYDGSTIYVTFSVGSGEGGLISGESVDLSSTNAEGETTHAAGRVWFPHWITVYTGSAQPPYFYRVEVDGVVTAEGATDDTSFSAPASGRRCKACIWASDGGESCQEFDISQ